MGRVRGLSLAVLLGACALVVAGCGSTKKAAPPAPKVSPPVCAHPAGWRKLAVRIDAPVYCPGWLPDPLSGQIGAVDNNIDSVSKSDRSYLESWVWQGVDLGGTSGELHINLRGYPGRTKIPTCRTGGSESKNVPCFDEASGTYDANGIHATEYTVNQDADQWHIAYVWRAYGGLYTISEHVAPPLTANRVVAYLKHQIRRLVVIKPGASA
jgi:hypothetical protein